MIHIVENKAYKSDSDRSLRSYYDRLRERIEAADFNVNNLTLEIKETLEYINSVNEMLEEFRVELTGDVEEIRPFLPEKQKGSLDGTLDKIKEALQDNDIKGITKEIEDASVCLAACQSCFTGTYDRCINVDNCAFTHGSGNVCTDCVSEQIGCRFCDSDQNTCIIEDSPCGEEYTSACNSCYQKLYNSCSQEQLTCDYSAGCTNCQNNVQSCNRCFNTTYSTCSNCYGGSYNTCGEGQVGFCMEDWSSEFCISSIDPGCAYTAPDECKASWDKECGKKYQNCPKTYSLCVSGNGVFCLGGQTTCAGGHTPNEDAGGVDDSCVYQYTWNSGTGYYVVCNLGYDGESCKAGYKLGVSGEDPISCPHDHGLNCGTNNSSCTGGFTAPGTNCPRKHATTDGETYCASDFEGSSDWVGCKSKFDGDSCQTGYRDDLHGIDCEQLYVKGPPAGCMNKYSEGGITCNSCYGIAYGCSGCYDVAYCSKCNTAQTSCTSCVKGQTTCDTCVKGEEGHQEDVCSNCYGGCQATWEQQKDCFTGSYGTPPACTICNIGCQYCDTGCYSGQSCGDCGDCGSSNCGASNCGSANCGTANCGTGQCNQSGCENCDDVSACVCAHTGSYGCNFPMHF